MWIQRIALFFLIIFAVIGAATLSVVLHEYSHFNDYRGLNVSDDQICGLVLPKRWPDWNYIKEPMGEYRFNVNNSDETTVEQVRQIGKYTEIKAYIISGLVILFFTICYFIIIFDISNNKLKIIDQEIESLQKDIYIQQLERHILGRAERRTDNANIVSYRSDDMGSTDPAD